MIYVRPIIDNNWLELSYGNYLEMSEIRNSLTAVIPNGYVLKKKCPWKNIHEAFYKTISDANGIAYVDENGYEHDIVRATLWYHLINVCKEKNLSISFSENFNDIIINKAVTKDSYKNFMRTLFGNSEMSVRDYQVQAAYNALVYKNSCLEVATSGGKTLMTYILFKYMIDVLGYKHILYVTPATTLTKQSSEKFNYYDELCHVESNWTYNEIHSKAKKKAVYEETIIFGNYQSLRNKPAGFFDKYDTVIIDECHHSAAASLRNILSKCSHATYKIGLTGTFPEEGSYQNLVIQSNLGPVLYNLTPYELINEKKCATPVYVNSLVLKYLNQETLGELFRARAMKDEDDPTAGGKILDSEKSIARNNQVRFKYITDMLMNTTKNSLGIFSDIQNNYGRKIYEHIKENSDKHVFYIDGDTPNVARDYAKEYMENDESGNTIIIASMQCFSEGIDIANLWNIFLLETTKSTNTLAQLLGRGMRKHPKKDKTTMIDFVDDFRYCVKGGGKYKENYLYKHGKERLKIYNKKRFPCNIFEVDLVTKSSSAQIDLLA